MRAGLLREDFRKAFLETQRWALGDGGDQGRRLEILAPHSVPAPGPPPARLDGTLSLG